MPTQSPNKTQASHQTPSQACAETIRGLGPIQAQVTGVPTIEVRPQGGAFFVRTQAPSVWSQPSTWISVVAVIVSISSLIVTLFDKYLGYRKDLRSREQSIQDEFWLRKVLFPSAIEPAMNFAVATMGNLPAPASSAEVFEAYFLDFQREHRGHARKLLLVATMWPDVYKKLNGDFETIEDGVAEYCSSAPVDPDGAIAGHTKVTNEISLALSNFCEAIRDHQKTIK